MALAKPMSYKRPKDLKGTLLRLLRYLGAHKLSLAAVAVMVVLSSMANILGTYLLRPVIRNFIEPGDIAGLGRMVLKMAAMYDPDPPSSIFRLPHPRGTDESLHQ